MLNNIYFYFCGIISGYLFNAITFILDELLRGKYDQEYKFKQIK